MFHSNEEKISLACAILRDNEVTPCLFLKKCRDAGGESFILVCQAERPAARRRLLRMAEGTRAQPKQARQRSCRA